MLYVDCIWPRQLAALRNETADAGQAAGQDLGPRPVGGCRYGQVCGAVQGQLDIGPATEN
jgi:hypothetical protein